MAYYILQTCKIYLCNDVLMKNKTRLDEILYDTSIRPIKVVIKINIHGIMVLLTIFVSDFLTFLCEKKLKIDTFTKIETFCRD